MEKYTLSVLLCQRKRFNKFFSIMRISTLLLFVCIFTSYASNGKLPDSKSEYYERLYDYRDFYQEG